MHKKKLFIIFISPEVKASGHKKIILLRAGKGPFPASPPFR